MHQVDFFKKKSVNLKNFFPNISTKSVITNIKPLASAKKGDLTFFSSELTPIIHLSPESAELDYLSLYRFLVFWYNKEFF